MYPVPRTCLAHRSFQSMQQMLQEECSSGMHAPGGILADPSAAIGLLWARRGLLFWVCLFRPHAQAYEASRRAAGSSDDRAVDADTSDSADADVSDVAVESGVTESEGGQRASASGRASPWRTRTDGPHSGSATEATAPSEAPGDSFTDNVSSISQKLLSGVISPTGQ